MREVAEVEMWEDAGGKGAVHLMEEWGPFDQDRGLRSWLLGGRGVVFCCGIRWKGIGRVNTSGESRRLGKKSELDVFKKPLVRRVGKEVAIGGAGVEVYVGVVSGQTVVVHGVGEGEKGRLGVAILAVDEYAAGRSRTSQVLAPLLGVCPTCGFVFWGWRRCWETRRWNTLMMKRRILRYGVQPMEKSQDGLDLEF